MVFVIKALCSNCSCLYFEKVLKVEGYNCIIIHYTGISKLEKYKVILFKMHSFTLVFILRQIRLSYISTHHIQATFRLSEIRMNNHSGVEWILMDSKGFK